MNNYQFTDAALSHAPPFEILENFHKKICDATPKKERTRVHLIMIIVEGSRTNRHYNEIKYWGDCERGVATQILASSVLLKQRKVWRSCILNLSMKVNCKLGGINIQFCSWNERPDEERVCKNIKYGNFLVFGADVTHPDQGTNNPSFGVVVGSLDFGCSLYGAKIFQQGSNQEVMTGLEYAVKELLLDFQERNRNADLPKVLYNNLYQLLKLLPKCSNSIVKVPLFKTVF